MTWKPFFTSRPDLSQAVSLATALDDMGSGKVCTLLYPHDQREEAILTSHFAACQYAKKFSEAPKICGSFFLKNSKDAKTLAKKLLSAAMDRGEFWKLPFYFYDAPLENLMPLGELTRLLKRRHGLNLLLISDLEMLSGTSFAQNLSTLESLAEEIDIKILCITRSREQDIPDVSSGIVWEWLEALSGGARVICAS